MLKKLLGVRGLWRRKSAKADPAAPSPREDCSSVLKIVHAGGVVEHYYMAVPALEIMEKHPSCLLARPDIFRSPWNSLVWPDQILVPGEKFFLVPRYTVKKLRSRIQQQHTGDSSIDYSVSQLSIDSSGSDSFVSGESWEERSSKSIMRRRRKGNDTGRTRINPTNVNPDDSFSFSSSDSIKSARRGPSDHERRKRRVKNVVTWHPTLNAIREASPAHAT